MSSQKCFFTRISDLKNFDDPNINKIKIAVIDGNQTVVGIDSNIGDTGILFYPDCVLTDEFISNEGLSHKYFNKRRVKVSRFKGVWSDVFFIKKSKKEVDRIFNGNYSLGDALPEGYIYNNFVLPVSSSLSSSSNRSGSKKVSMREFKDFQMHYDTEQFRSYTSHIKNLYERGWSVSISTKVHGTSGRTYYGKLPLFLSTGTFLNKIEKFFFNKIKNLDFTPLKGYKEYFINKYFNSFSNEIGYVSGSRRVILENYSFLDIRSRAEGLFYNKLEEGMTVYYEILGYERKNTPIMSPNNGVPYSYGLEDGDFGVHVYRITKDGKEFTPREVVDYCESVLGIASVEYSYCSISEKYTNINWDSLFKIIDDQFKKSSSKNYALFINSGEVVSLKYNHINEGIVVRLDPPEGCKDRVLFYKLKLPEFYLAEGLIASADLASMKLEQE